MNRKTNFLDIRHWPLVISATFCFAALLFFGGCDRNPLTGSKLTLDNYNRIATGMSKTQVEQILGPPTTTETKDMLLFKKTTYRYEQGKDFAMISFKNDEVDTKESNLAAAP